MKIIMRGFYPDCHLKNTSRHPLSYRPRNHGFARLAVIFLIACALPCVSHAASLVYQGLLNTSLGGATMNAVSSIEVISNLGSSGQDGVGISIAPSSTKLQVGLADLDASNALPGQADIQSQIFGTAAEVTNGVLGTLTATKSSGTGGVGTDLFVDFSPMGVSTYTMQAYYQGALVAQAGKQNSGYLPLSSTSFQAITGMGLASMVADCCVSNLSSGGQDGLTIAFAGGTSLSVSGRQITFDQLCFIPENVPSPNAVTAFQIVASHIPSITITGENESIEYQGIINTSLGGAAMNAVSSEEYVSNLGSGGQDGVGLTILANLIKLNVSLDDLDASNTLPFDADIQSQIFGTAGSVTNGVLGTLTATKSASPVGAGTALFLNFSPMGVSTYTVQAYYQGVMVAQAGNQSADFLSLATTSYQNISAMGLASMVADCCVSNLSSGGQDGLTITFAGGASASVGGQQVTCDQLCFIPENVPSQNQVSAFQIVASQIPSFTITAENESMPYSGLVSTSLGNATMNVVNSEDYVTNLNSSGQDGVTFAMPANLTKLDLNWDSLDPSNTLPTDAYVQSQIVGTANGITNGVLGTLTAAKAAAAGGAAGGTGGTAAGIGLFLNFSPLGVSTYTLQAYDQGSLVADAGAQSSTYLSLSSTSFQSISGMGLASMVADCCVSNLSSGGQDGLTITFAGGTSGSIAGQFVTFDQLSFIPENVPSPTGVSAFQIVASQVPSITFDSVDIAPLLVSASHSGQNLSLQWTGSAALQESTDLTTWTDDTNATSPYSVTATASSGQKKFYRLVFRP